VKPNGIQGYYVLKIREARVHSYFGTVAVVNYTKPSQELGKKLRLKSRMRVGSSSKKPIWKITVFERLVKFQLLHY